MKISSFDFTFPGFIDQGVCGITVGPGLGDAVVIICSQKSNYYGTSVTNAVEQIAVKLFKDVMTRSLTFSDEVDSSALEDLRAQWKRRLGARKHYKLAEIYKRGEVTWVEHYPPDAGLLPEHNFSEVVFDDHGNPTWLAARSTTSAIAAFGDVARKAIEHSKGA